MHRLARVASFMEEWAPMQVPDQNSHETPLCPDCHRELSFVCSWTSRGLWGFEEVRTYECPEHGPVFVRPERSATIGPLKRPDVGDLDSPIPVARRRPLVPSTDVSAVPEPRE